MQSSLTDFVDWYRNRVLRTVGHDPSPSTLKNKRSKLRVAMRDAGAADLVALSTICQDRSSVVALYDRLATHQQPQSMRGTVQALIDFSAYSAAQGWGALAVTKEDLPKGGPRTTVEVYEPEEVEVLVAAARGQGHRWWLFLLTLAETGRRVSEVLSLTFDACRVDAEPPHFDLGITKNGRHQLVPLSPALQRAWAKAEWDDTRAARPGDVYPFPWTYATAQERFERFCARVGVQSRGFHCFRHTKATSLLARGVPLQAVSALLGHQSTATTDRVYNHTTALSYAQFLT